MNKTVLVVDDAAIIRQINTLTLKKEGFDVVEAIHGKDALKKITGRIIDLVVTDINMPEMDGIELIRELRNMEEFRFTLIIVLSTLAQEDRVKQGKEAGALQALQRQAIDGNGKKVSPLSVGGESPPITFFLRAREEKL